MPEMIALDCIDCNGFGGWEVQIGCELGWHRCKTCDGAGCYIVATETAKFRCAVCGEESYSSDETAHKYGPRTHDFVKAEIYGHETS